MMFCWSPDTKRLHLLPYTLPFASAVTINNHRCRNHVHIVKKKKRMWFVFPNRNNPRFYSVCCDHRGALLSNWMQSILCRGRTFQMSSHAYTRSHHRIRTLFIIQHLMLVVCAHISYVISFVRKFGTLWHICTTYTHANYTLVSFVSLHFCSFVWQTEYEESQDTNINDNHFQFEQLQQK